MDPSTLLAGASDLVSTQAFKVRSYQREMVEESMKRNIIVAMETGSGKTMVAILRMEAALERCSPEKLVWFCVPTVELAMQQHRVISNHLPAFQARALSGADNVDCWTKQWIWDEVLKDIRIVVSTHQVLLDALIHGFVPLRRLELMVFDEAHSCVNNHPSSRILREFYHMSAIVERPAILGLTASPIVNSKVGNLESLELNLNAISRTPKIHRDELLLHVHPPKLIRLFYPPTNSALPVSIRLGSLRSVYHALNIDQDPWIIRMRSDPSTCDYKALQKALASQKTYCHDQIKGLYTKALAIEKGLGPSAADFYISECIEKFRKVLFEGSLNVKGFNNDEKLYLHRKFSDVQIHYREGAPSFVYADLSPKVHVLIDCLRKEDSADFSGLIFVRTRAEVAVLSQILSVHTRSFKITTFVGTSANAGRSATVSELADVKNQKNTLDDLRHGKKNLVITTNALEEGIDVSRCKLVCCFDRPPNLKSFIQRRGRARKSDSKYIIMFEDGPKSEITTTWTALEAEMREIYMDEERQLHQIREEEDTIEESIREHEIFFINSTGAKLTLGDAVQHLYHFCATLPAEPYVDRSPVFAFEEYGKYRSANVTLPNSVNASVRHARGVSRWKTEKMAKRDAAFQCYKALYNAGLVDNNLLPLGHVNEDRDKAYAAVEKRPGLVEVSEQMNPWPFVARKWRLSTTYQSFSVKVVEHGKLCGEMMMLLPCELPSIEGFDLYWNVTTSLRVTIGSELRRFDPTIVAPAMQTTSLLLKSVFPGRVDCCDHFTVPFIPVDTENFNTWAQTFDGALKAEDCPSDIGDDVGLVRNNGVPYMLQEVVYASVEDLHPDSSMDINGNTVINHVHPTHTLLGGIGSHDQNEVTEKVSSKQNQTVAEHSGHSNSAEIADEYSKTGDFLGRDFSEAVLSSEILNSELGDNHRVETLLKVIKLPKKIDFLHQSPGLDSRTISQSKLAMLPAEACKIDRLPFKYSRFAMLIPSILHRIEIAMVVDRLCAGILSPVGFQNRSLVATAISASSAREGTDYQRLEFFGDSMLKFMTSLALTAEHLNYHEGILSHMKDHIVSNSSLASAAIRMGLDAYILTKAFTGRRWRPLYNNVLLESNHEQKREMSSKTLADVVEALIGAAYLDGGFQKAFTLLSISLPDVPWSVPCDACRKLSAVYDLQIQESPHLNNIQNLVAYQFNSKALLIEALTHGSHYGPNSGSSYQRLEFLGDAVLDNIVTKTAFAHQPSIPTHQLHLIRTALVNGNFLGFLSLVLSISLPRTDPVTDDSENVTTVEALYPFYLWQAMRHASPTICLAQQECLERHKDLQTTILELLARGDRYPWTALARLEPPKPMSDMVESLLGAIYIDSQGSFSVCEHFLEHLGLMAYLRRVMQGGVALLHPKEELGQLADRDKVRYELGKLGEEREQRLMCRVIVGENEVVKVGDGLSIMEVQTRAANEACEILKNVRAKVHDGSETYDTEMEDTEADEEAVEQQTQDIETEEESDSDVYMTADE